jgi:hypothetical protein
MLSLFTLRRIPLARQAKIAEVALWPTPNPVYSLQNLLACRARKRALFAETASGSRSFS